MEPISITEDSKTYKLSDVVKTDTLYGGYVKVGGKDHLIMTSTEKGLDDFITDLYDSVGKGLLNTAVRWFFIGGIFGIVASCMTTQARAQDIPTRIATASAQLEFDPNLAVAIAKVESNLNPRAVGKIGEIGLFQLRPEFHKIQKGYSIEKQTYVAVNYLKQLETKCGSKLLQCYNLGPTKALRLNFETTKYQAKVGAVYENLLYPRGLSLVKSRNDYRKIFKTKVPGSVQRIRYCGGFLRSGYRHRVCEQKYARRETGLDLLSRAGALQARHDSEAQRRG